METREAKAEALREAAEDAEWQFRSASFACGRGEATARLHPVGQWLRDRAERILSEESKP